MHKMQLIIRSISTCLTFLIFSVGNYHLFVHEIFQDHPFLRSFIIFPRNLKKINKLEMKQDKK